MSAPDFLDTNILIYAFDSTDTRKQSIARKLVEEGVAGRCQISLQVLAEFAAVQLRKSRTPAEAVLEILDTLRPIPARPPDPGIVRRAVEAHAIYGVHFYDGMVIAAAERAGCSRIWSEDLNRAQEYFGVRVQNPFQAARAGSR
jgi:predicted nucleic acid-binding protein